MHDDFQAVWKPTPRTIEQARITQFTTWLSRERGVDVGGDYHRLWAWSVENTETFWAAVWDYFDVEHAQAPTPVLTNTRMPGAQWFPGAQLNYVNQILRHARADRPALIDHSEPGGIGVRECSWAELLRQVAAVAATLRGMGVQPGDRVVGYLPHVAETVIAFLATASIGAIWSVCGQDYAAAAVAARLGQLDPVVLVTADGYRYGGKDHDRRAEVDVLRGSLPTLRHTIVIPRLGLAHSLSEQVASWATASAGNHPLKPTPVPFDQPLWVLFSSGTTGRPKGIVHGHGGVLLEHLKSAALHLDLGPEDTYFWYTSPSWMMWNFQVAGLLVGSTIVCYDGNPTYPGPDALWELAARHRVTVLGTSPAHVQACQKAGVHPAAEHDLTRLRLLGATGSTVPATAYQWAHQQVGSDVQFASTTGGTDVVTGFAGGARTVPVWPAEISAPCLGVALDAWDEKGRSVRDEVGELVVTRPMPSMPLSFWGDADGSRYHGAYFDVYPGVWRHGDWITITSRGTIIVHGRSDSTLNRNGVRMGSADIHHAVEQLPEIIEALVIGAEQPDGTYWMPLFVELADGAQLDQELTARIRAAIRDNVSPRHLPDEIIHAPGVPHTRTGKKLEIPIKRLLQGAAIDAVADPATIDRPELLDWYIGRRRPGVG
ncbi:acetoacetate--CoA ligase [Frankia sp. Cj5]|uniref:acetoacetate--CoA ligase n=1 Tax=Frankia sp. Cj5 TaxID=2880978 RepID=UPI001EF3D986|nr:acetoacetate--CoA ligase [Frankia sp. Cj5]